MHSSNRILTCRVDVERDSIHVYSGGQGIWDDRNDIARVLGISNDQVTVELITNGGAFGGKEDMSNQAHAALAAWLLKRPVKCTLSREESFRMHAKRHPITMEYTAGCDADGRLTALKVRAIGDSGAYASVGMKVLERMAGHAAVPTSSHTSTLKRSLQERTIRFVEHFAASALTKHSSQWKASSTALPRSVELTAGHPITQRHQTGHGVGSRTDHG